MILSWGANENARREGEGLRGRTRKEREWTDRGK